MSGEPSSVSLAGRLYWILLMRTSNAGDLAAFETGLRLRGSLGIYSSLKPTTGGRPAGAGIGNGTPC
jgi:hypothetical protein